MAGDSISQFVSNFFVISFGTMNLFSFILGVMTGLCSSTFDRHKPWLGVVGYFIMIALYYAVMGWAFGR